MITYSEHSTVPNINGISDVLGKIRTFFNKVGKPPVRINAVVYKDDDVHRCTIWLSEQIVVVPFAKTMTLDSFADVNRRPDIAEKLIAAVEMSYSSEWVVEKCIKMLEFHPVDYPELTDFLVL